LAAANIWRAGVSAAAASSGDHWPRIAAWTNGALRKSGSRYGESRSSAHARSVDERPMKSAPAISGLRRENGVATIAAGSGYNRLALNG
jgi:hypothetical protein